MNHRRGVIALIVAFVFIFCFGFVWHGILMKSAYMETAALWPLTTNILWMWIAGSLIGFAIMGALVGAIYKPKTA